MFISTQCIRPSACKCLPDFQQSRDLKEHQVLYLLNLYWVLEGQLGLASSSKPFGLSCFTLFQGAFQVQIVAVSVFRGSVWKRKLISKLQTKTRKKWSRKSETDEGPERAKRFSTIPFLSLSGGFRPVTVQLPPSFFKSQSLCSTKSCSVSEGSSEKLEERRLAGCFVAGPRGDQVEQLSHWTFFTISDLGHLNLVDDRGSASEMHQHTLRCSVLGSLISGWRDWFSCGVTTYRWCKFNWNLISDQPPRRAVGANNREPITVHDKLTSFQRC